MSGDKHVLDLLGESVVSTIAAANFLSTGAEKIELWIRQQRPYSLLEWTCVVGSEYSDEELVVEGSSHIFPGADLEVVASTIASKVVHIWRDKGK